MTCGDHQGESSAAMAATPEASEYQETVNMNNKQTLTRLVSEVALSTMSETGKTSPQYVSGCEGDEGKQVASCARGSTRSDSPMRCVSEVDEVSSESKETGIRTNSLCCARLRAAHLRALRLEADLQPMRMILGRLMSHPLNKKGLFNTPVNALALGLVDYHQIIKNPMDLGTIKSRLYSLAYQSKQDVAADICLVFQNAMLYNPARNAVHIAARSLQDFFGELYVAVGGAKKSLPPSVSGPHAAPSSVSRRVSFTEAPQIHGLEGRSPVKVGEGIMRTVSCDVGSAMEAAMVATTHLNNFAPRDLLVTGSKGGGPSGPAEGSLPLGSPLASTRGRGTFASSAPPMEIKHERKRRLSYSGHKRTQGHSCRSCLGRICLLCEQSCLPLEPTLLVCNGANCAGARIRKGATYYIASDGSRQYCQRCFTSLPPVLSPTAEDEATRYKRDLLRRKNDEELVEAWLTCSKCDMGVHQMCALHYSSVHSDAGYTCPGCISIAPKIELAAAKGANERPRSSHMYTFITGSENPVPLSEVSDGSSHLDHQIFSAEALGETSMSAFIEAKVRDRLKSTANVPNSEKTVTIRIVSDCDRSFKVPEVVRKHFRMATSADAGGVVTPPAKVNFKSKAIAVFQKVDGLDVCIFCMYVQEYEGDDNYGDDHTETPVSGMKKRVYIAYLDSVEHFRPRSSRTTLYHELLVSYLATARLRGFVSAHIWACPPSRGNSFVFWNHPSSQRTPTKERLISWYHGALSRAINCGVVTDVKSMFESDFQEHLKESNKENEEGSAPLDPSGKMVCPPLLEGDYWIEEAVRIHAASLARHLKAKSPNEGKDLTELYDSPLPEIDPCPARQISALLLDRIMAHTSAAPFRRPVNAAALKLKDYHKIITNPMDLGTVYTRCVHGEYARLQDLVEDVQLVFQNAKTFNPPGNFVHNMAVEMEELFFKQLERVTENWSGGRNASCGWKAFSKMSMSLDVRLEQRPEIAPANICRQGTPSVADGWTKVDGLAAKPQMPSLGTDSTAVTSAQEMSFMKIADANAAPPTVEQLLSGDPAVVSQRMAGEDRWMIEKKSNIPPKKPSVSKNGNAKRRRSSGNVPPLSEEEPSPKRRRQTWLGEEVGASVRSMRTSFFACSLVPANSMSTKQQEKADAYLDYTRSYEPCEEKPNKKVIMSHIADARSALLEFSQRRNLEFDTLRHAKYSTTVLLYHLHNHEAPGVIPTCTTCNQETTDCRWHKIVKVEELRKTSSKRKKTIGTPAMSDADKAKYNPEELCTGCHAKHPQKEQFIPLPVSFPSD